MLPDKILQSSLLDIIFEHKNKGYGAYALRRDYNRRLIVAMLCVPVLLLLITLLHFYFRDKDRMLVTSYTIPDLGTHEFIDPPKPPEPPKATKPPAARPPAATIQYAAFLISEEASDTIPDIETLAREDRLISTVTREGIAPVEIAPPAPPSENEGNGMEPIPEKEAEPEILETADHMPEFPGGKSALYRFLSRNLRVPELLQSGEKVRLQVRFYIDLQGMVNGIEFENREDAVFEREVIRVIQKMPRWTPGLRRGKPVQVYYRIPIIFQVPE